MYRLKSMPIFLFPLPVLAIAGIFYFIVSGKSAPAVRRAAIAACILALLTILVCSVFILSRPAAVAGPNYSPGSEDPATPVSPLNIALVIGMSLIFLFFVLLVVIAARREQRRRKNG
jgi:TRAP-type C4-dicarboxylate transport system permease small subunit